MHPSLLPSLVPTAARSLLPQPVAFNAAEQAMLDDLYEAAEIDAICDLLFKDVLL